MRPRFRYIVIGFLLAQLFLLSYIARLDYQIRAIAALSYVELSSR